MLEKWTATEQQRCLQSMSLQLRNYKSDDRLAQGDETLRNLSNRLSVCPSANFKLSHHRFSASDTMASVPKLVLPRVLLV